MRDSSGFSGLFIGGTSLISSAGFPLCEEGWGVSSPPVVDLVFERTFSAFLSRCCIFSKVDHHCEGEADEVLVHDRVLVKPCAPF